MIRQNVVLDTGNNRPVIFSNGDSSYSGSADRMSGWHVRMLPFSRCTVGKPSRMFWSVKLMTSDARNPCEYAVRMRRWSRLDCALAARSKRVSVRLDDELIAWLDQTAAEENRSRANLIETLLKQARVARGVKQ